MVESQTTSFCYYNVGPKGQIFNHDEVRKGSSDKESKRRERHAFMRCLVVLALDTGPGGNAMARMRYLY